MKSLAIAIALSIAAAVTAPAFAQTTTTPANKADCEKMAGKKWDDKAKTCVSK